MIHIELGSEPTGDAVLVKGFTQQGGALTCWEERWEILHQNREGGCLEYDTRRAGRVSVHDAVWLKLPV